VASFYLADLIAYTSRARRTGSRESVRLQQNPAQVVACIEDYARDVLELLHQATPAD
jgi:hypothetical protein